MYPYMPYGTSKPVSTRVGRALSQEQKEKMQAGRKAKILPGGFTKEFLREPGSFKIGKLPQ
jgi:hypothetical protein